MTKSTYRKHPEQGPFRADGLEPGGYYEISHGHPVQLAPSGTRHGSANVIGALPLATDPMVVEMGIDVGHKLAEDTVRAPDVSVGGVDGERGGWAKGAPPLAVEYADEGTKEADLQTKIEEYFGAGAKFVWVVRLVGPRRVEAYSAPDAMTLHTGESLLEAPGVLQEKLPAAALWDRRVALDVSMRNLLLRAGYKDIAQVREEGREVGREEGREEGREVGREEGREQGQLALVVAALESALGRALHSAESARARDEVRAGRALALIKLASQPPAAIEAALR